MHLELGQERTAKVLQRFMSDNANRFVMPGMKGFGIEGNDAWALASYFKMATGDVIGYKCELSRPEPNVVHDKLFSPCILFPKLDIPAEFYKAMGCFEVEAAEMINPNIEIRHKQLMTDGEPCRELWFVEKE